MGISTDAVLIVGINGKFIDADKLSDFIDNEELQYASYRYDADPQTCIVGIVVATDDDGPLNIDVLLADIDKAKAKFFELTGIHGNLHVEPNVT